MGGCVLGSGWNIVMLQGSVLAYKLALRQMVLQGWSSSALRMCLVWCAELWGSAGWSRVPAGMALCRDGDWKSLICMVYVVLDPKIILFTYIVNAIGWNSHCKGYLDYPLLSPKIKWNFWGALGSKWSKPVNQDRGRGGEKVNHWPSGDSSVRQKSIMSFQFASFWHLQWNSFSCLYMGKALMCFLVCCSWAFSA